MKLRWWNCSNFTGGVSGADDAKLHNLKSTQWWIFGVKELENVAFSNVVPFLDMT